MANFSTWVRGLFGAGAATRTQGVQSGESGSFPDSPAVAVNADTALCLSAWWACVRLLSETVASMPLIFYEANPDGTANKEKPITTHSLATLFRFKPNRYQTRFGFWETMTMQECSQGNAYALKQFNERGDIIGLLPMMAAQTRVILEKDGSLTYEYSDGTTTRKYTEKDIWHTPLMGNGIVGLSPLSYARNSIAIGLAADKRTGKIFRRGGKPAGMLTIDHVLKPDQRAAVKENFNEMVEGDADSLFVLEAGMEYTQISLSPKDIELLASKAWQLKDVARFMGVPPVMIGDADSTTVWGSGIDKIVEGFYKFGLRPYLERFEASIIANLLKPEERTKIQCEFDFNALLRGDLAARIKTKKEAVTGGIMTPNEARKDEGLPPIEGGNEIYMQQQMVPLKMLAKGDGLKSRTGIQPDAGGNNG